MKLEGKVALVTGGGTGTGKEIVLAFAREGAAIAVNYSRSRDDADQTVAELEGLGARAFAVKADVSNGAEVDAMVGDVVAKLGRLDILVNCAGYTSFVQLDDLDGITDDIWDRTIAVNMRGVFECSRRCVREMRTSGSGAIVNISGTAGLTGLGSSIIYCATKAAILSFTRSMAISLAPTIRVNAISPGIIAGTRWTAGQESFNENGRRQTPMGRLATVSDIADAALYLVSGGEFINGQNIIVDGGRVVR